MTIAFQVYACFAAGMNNKATLKKIQDDNPHAKTQMNSIYWYRNESRKQGLKLVASEAVKVTDKQLWDALHASQAATQERAEFEAWRAARQAESSTSQPVEG